MNTRALLLLLCCVVTQWKAGLSASRADKILYAMAPEGRGAYFVNPKSGRYNYGYNTGDGIAKVEVRQLDGSIVGSYRYFDPNGKQVVRSYVADNKGFRVLGNDLPISPDTPVSHISGLPAFTGAVEGTEDFEIPPPLSSTSLPSQLHQRPYYHHLLKEKQLLEQQQTQYQREQQKLEAVRRQLRELEAQRLQLQHKLSGSYTTHTYQTVTHDPNLLGPIRNHLTHGYTSPYRYFDNDMHYDFPAGFTYNALPTIVNKPRRTRYPYADYIIGQAR